MYIYSLFVTSLALTLPLIINNKTVTHTHQMDLPIVSFNTNKNLSGGETRLLLMKLFKIVLPDSPLRRIANDYSISQQKKLIPKKQKRTHVDPSSLAFSLSSLTYKSFI
jgi:hypothetical protein